MCSLIACCALHRRTDVRSASKGKFASAAKNSHHQVSLRAAICTAIRYCETWLSKISKLYGCRQTKDDKLAEIAMNVNLVIVATAAVFLAAPSILHAQLSDLPVRPGLWDVQVSMNGSASVPGQYCFSAGTTLGDYLTASNKGAPGAQCSVSNKVKTARGVSYDTACTSQAMNSKGHIDVQLPDSGHFSGTSHTVVTRNSGGKPMNIDKTFKASFAKPDCGNIKPLVLPSSGK